MEKSKWILQKFSTSAAKKYRVVECERCGKGHLIDICIPFNIWLKEHKFCEKCGAVMQNEQDVIKTTPIITCENCKHSHGVINDIYLYYQCDYWHSVIYDLNGSCYKVKKKDKKYE